MLLSQEWVRFLRVDPDHQPVLAIAAEEPPEAAAPVDRASTAHASPLPGWSVLPRQTFVLVEAPDDEGFSVLCSDPARVDEVGGWLDAVTAAMGTWLVFVPLDRFNALASGPGTGFVEGHGGWVGLAGGDRPTRSSPAHGR